MTRILRAAAFGVLMTAVSATAHAQATPRTSFMTSTPAATAADDARPVSTAIVATTVERDRLVQGARQHIASARLLGSADPRAVECLTRAGRLFAHAGEYAQSRDALAAAADAALMRGDIIAAAHLNVDVALAAQLAGDIDRVNERVDRAQTLVLSPLLTDSQRQRVLTRIVR